MALVSRHLFLQEQKIKKQKQKQFEITHTVFNILYTHIMHLK